MLIKKLEGIKGMKNVRSAKNGSYSVTLNIGLTTTTFLATILTKIFFFRETKFTARKLASLFRQELTSFSLEIIRNLTGSVARGLFITKGCTNMLHSFLVATENQGILALSTLKNRLFLPIKSLKKVILKKLLMNIMRKA